MGQQRGSTAEDEGRRVAAPSVHGGVFTSDQVDPFQCSATTVDRDEQTAPAYDLANSQAADPDPPLKATSTPFLPGIFTIVCAHLFPFRRSTMTASEVLVKVSPAAHPAVAALISV
jgi:hypothetical protein